MPSTAALYDIEALRLIEAGAAARLGDGHALMAQAGERAWRELLLGWPAAQGIVVVCGPGNNGGDGYVLARHAHESGRDVLVCRQQAHAPQGPAAARACADYAGAGGRVQEWQGTLPPADLIVDALFGIGLSRAPDAASTGLIEAMTADPAPVLALDVPSGVDARTGAVPGAAVEATRTVEFIAPKAALRTGAALDFTGQLALAVLPLAAAELAVGRVRAARCAEDDLAQWLPARRRDSHKGRNGRVLCVGGDLGHGGAVVLAADAALHAGAGLVEVATRAAHLPALLARRPEAMVHVSESDTDEEAAATLARSSVVALGPGLGQAGWGAAWFARALACGVPLVLDADALNVLARRGGRLPPDTVITPHPGEAARLLDTQPAKIQADRFGAADALCKRHGCVVVLKGAGTLVAAPGKVVRLIDAGNPGMAVGGMGDLLTGVIAALRAQGLGPFDAATCGALLHALAGDRAASALGQRGLLPSDLLPHLRRLANPEQQW